MKKKIALSGVLVLGLLFAVLVFSSGALLRSGIEAAGSSATGTTTTLESASLAVFSGRVNLQGLVVGNPAGFQTQRAAAIQAIEAEASVTSLLGNTVQVQHIIVDSPEVTIELGPNGTNLGRILENLERHASPSSAPQQPGPQEPAPEASPGKRLVVRLVRIVTPRVTIAQSVVGATQLTLQLGTIELTDLSTGDDATAEGAPATTTLPGVISQSLAAIAAAASKHSDIPGNIAALLQNEIRLPSLEQVTQQTLENLKQVDLGDIGKGLEETGKNLRKSVEGLIPRKPER